jgi:hypothetical protein
LTPFWALYLKATMIDLITPNAALALVFETLKTNGITTLLVFKVSLYMKRKSLTVKKHLCFDSLRDALSIHFLAIKDPRQLGKCSHSSHDALMSGFACMFFQDASVAEFQRRMEVRSHQNNLRQLFHAESIPKDSQIRELIDGWIATFYSPSSRTF